MKKLSFILMFLFASAASLYADENIKIESGNVSVVKTSNVATYEFDYSNTLIEGKPVMEYLKGRGTDFVKYWPEESEFCEAEFMDTWNRKNKKGLVLTNSGNAKYHVVVEVSKIDLGSFAASFTIGFGAGGAKMSCKIKVYETGLKTPVLVIDVKNQTGGSATTEKRRRADMYKELAEDVSKTIKKAK